MTAHAPEGFFAFQDRVSAETAASAIPSAAFATQVWVATGYTPDVVAEALAQAIERGLSPDCGEVLTRMLDAVEGWTC